HGSQPARCPGSRFGRLLTVWLVPERLPFVWFCLEASPDQTNRTRQNETRRKDEPRRIKMNPTLQDESNESDESRRI
ncbi:MAG TPA: hypothetical protein VKI65_05705, partial [Gemmataceae bacterium]|nr:hypothetical protein [Gemmataceae bacterium]